MTVQDAILRVYNDVAHLGLPKASLTVEPPTGGRYEVKAYSMGNGNVRIDVVPQ